MKILLVEDDTELAMGIEEYLRQSGHEVDHVDDGLLALHALATSRFDCVVLDIGLPGVDGLRVCEYVRDVAGMDLPILALTARDALEHKLAAFEKGVDDYLVKPFSLAELAARLGALEGRPHRLRHGKLLRCEDLTLDIDTLQIRRADRPLKLKRAAVKVLEMLMRQSHRVVRRDELEQMLWAGQSPESDVLRTHIHAIRNAVDRSHSRPLVHTVPGVGYRLCAPDDL